MTTCLGKSCHSFTARAFRKLLSIYVFGFEGRIWDLIVSVSDHCLFFYFTRGRGGRSLCWPSTLCFQVLLVSLFPRLILYVFCRSFQ